MTDQEKYLNALALLRQWRTQGIINDAEFKKGERAMMKKYCIKKDSIYRPNDLIKISF